MNNGFLNKFSSKNSYFKAFAKSLAGVMAIAALVYFAAPAPASAASSPGIVSTPSQEEIVLYAQEHPTGSARYSSSGIPEKGCIINYRIKPIYPRKGTDAMMMMMAAKRAVSTSCLV